jgi:hypothetical protein
MARTQKYFIGPQLLGDIRRVVGRVEAEPIGSEISRIETRLQDMPRRSGAPGLRRVTFTGSWNKGASKAIYFYGTTQTVSAMNVLATVTVGCNDPRDAFIASVDGVWQLIAAECA